MTKKLLIDQNEISLITKTFLSSPPRKNSATGLKGVTYRKLSDKYYAYCWLPNKKRKSLGGYFTARAAAKAYDKFVKEYIGDWAYTNFARNGKRTKIKK